MDGSSEASSYPFAAADLDIDMMDKVRTGANGALIRPVASGDGADDPAELARQVANIVQRLAERARELESQKQALEQQAAANAQAARSGEALRQTLRETVLSGSVSAEDLQTIQRVLAALARDPNHIMVLASVAQQAGKLTTIVDSFVRLHSALVQAPPS